MKVVIATPLFPPELGSPAEYVYTLAKRLRSEHRVTIVTYANHVEPIEKVRIRAISKNRPLLVRLFHYTRALIRAARGADVLYVQRGAAAGLPAIIAHWVVGTPVILNYLEDEAWERMQHTDTPPQHQGAFRRIKKIPGAVWGIWHVQHLVLTHASRVLAPSNYLANELLSTHQLSKKRMRVSYAPPMHRLTLPFSAKEAPHRIYMNTSLFPWKDVATAIRATALLRESYPDIELVVAGDGPELHELEEVAETQGVGTHVTFLGNVSRAEELNYLKSAGVFLSTATYEDRPDIFYDAFRESVPVIATDVPGSREAFVDKESGLRIPPGNAQTCAAAVRRIFSDPILGKNLAQNAKQKLEKEFSWKAHEKSLLAHLTTKV